MPQGLRIVVAGGGTGGHLYPGIAIVERIRERVHDAEVLFIGARGGMEEQILARSGFRSTLISGRGLRGASFLTKLASPFVVAAAVVRAMSVIRQFRADLVIGTGGYASAAAVIAAVVLRVPRVLQEQNSIPGMVNRRLARFADVMLLSYESSAKWLPSSVRTCVVGNPLRHMPVVERAPAAAHFGLAANTPTVLVIGAAAVPAR